LEGAAAGRDETRRGEAKGRGGACAQGYPHTAQTKPQEHGIMIIGGGQLVASQSRSPRLCWRRAAELRLPLLCSCLSEATHMGKPHGQEEEEETKHTTRDKDEQESDEPPCPPDPAGSRASGSQTCHRQQQQQQRQQRRQGSARAQAEWGVRGVCTVCR
jgi:hypothetical protein